jgi:hypothetical protein
MGASWASSILHESSRQSRRFDGFVEVVVCQDNEERANDAGMGVPTPVEESMREQKVVAGRGLDR